MALYWARRAARSGEPKAYLLVANILATSGLTSESGRMIFEAFRSAAEAGDADGQQSLAWCYEQGIGVKSDASQALYWLDKAAANGSKMALLALAKRYAEGDGVPVDDIKARIYLALAHREH